MNSIALQRSARSDMRPSFCAPQGAREEIRRSLDRLAVDHVDLLQLHNLVDVIEW
jgi:aryl-alcohol dehydrogenase-like predicted oxidoreductase